ncbi:MAG: GntR family transcriptional regulator [Spirochaetaceae bacterium]|nr:MAG: GntR family transcriptional regulator [Spirochaetaceae bacterium]
MPDFRTEYEKIYEAIRNAIITGQYAPGERLPQRKLAETFNTTTITVREALEGMAARLAAENLTDEDKRELMELAAECDRELVGDRMSRQDKANLHYKLHEKIVNITRCPELIQSINRSNLHTVILSDAYHIEWRSDNPEQHRNLA